MSAYEELVENIEKGVRGENVSLTLTENPYTKVPSKLGQRINLGKSTYMLFGGLSGTGKTAIVDSQFVINLYLYHKYFETTVKPYWVYRSMERPTMFKIAKWTCYLMYIHYGIRIDVPTLLQWGNKSRELSEKELQLSKGYKEWFEEFFKYMDIVQGAENPTGLRNYMFRVLNQKGTYIKASLKGFNVNGRKAGDFNPQDKEYKNGQWKFYKDITINGEERRIYQFDNFYVPKDENEIVFHITDHIGKLTTERNFSDKQILDKHSEYMGEFRDIFGVSPIDVSQFNRGLEDTFRRVKTQLDVLPSDFKSSGDPYENADIVIGLMNPYKLEAYNYNKYDIERFVNEAGYNRFRGMKIVKNSFGIDDFNIGYAFLGENGFMRELHRAEDMTSQIYNDVASGNVRWVLPETEKKKWQQKELL